MSVARNLFVLSESNSLLASALSLNAPYSFTQILDGKEAFKDGILMYQSNPPEFEKDLFSRFKKLLYSGGSSTEVHPYDVALATYLYFIHRVDPQKVTKYTKEIHKSKLKNLWFAQKVSALTSKDNKESKITEDIRYGATADEFGKDQTGNSVDSPLETTSHFNYS